MHLVDKDVVAGIAEKMADLRAEIPYLSSVQISSRLDLILADLELLDFCQPVLDHTRSEV